jgi:DNA-binding transcriptional LysR family regulator
VALKIREVSLRDPTAGLADGSTDVALVRLPLGNPEIVHEVLFAEPRVLAVATDHPLAQRESVRMADIIDEPLIATYTNDTTWDDFWLAVDVRPEGQRPVISHRVETLDEELMLVATQGAMTITAQAAERYLPRPGVACIPIADIPPSLGAVAWHRDRVSAVIMDFVGAAIAARDEVAGDNGSLSMPT